MQGYLITVAFVLILVSSLGASQECPSSIVGFTALTPHQLREEINTSLRTAVAEMFQAKEKTDDESAGDKVESLCCSALANLSVGSERLELTEEFTESVVSAVNSALENSLASIVERAVTESMRSVTQNLTRTIQEALSRVPTVVQPPLTTLPGLSPSMPASSCLEIYTLDPRLPSGLYWISAPKESPTQRYCDMSRTCGGVTGGWLKVVDIDMTRANDSCPTNFIELIRDSNPNRTCIVNSDVRGCYPSIFPTHGVPYNHVCGRIIGYQDRTPNAFLPFHIDQDLTIDEVFMDGVVLSHRPNGTHPRQHIWSFVAGLDETGTHLSACPCTNTEAERVPEIPSFVGQDYFCDTASEDGVRFEFYDKDPLWDGRGCGPLSSCCLFNNPPWFMKELSSNVTDDIEMRVCRDAGSVNENTPLEIIELYVR